MLMRTQKVESLQAYRALAAILVVLYHVTTYSRENFNFTFLGNVFAFGYTGVDFFFVLSGFIIFYTHSRDLGNTSRLVPYIKRRFIRIYPIYFLVTTLKILAIALIPTVAKGYERDLSVIIQSYLLIPQENFPIIAAAWTLSYELFFYILFGVAILLGERKAMWLLGAWVLGILAFPISHFVGVHLPMEEQLWARFAFNERNLEFVLGCLSAYLVLHYRPRWPGLLAILGILLFGLSAAYVWRGNVPPSYALMFGVPSFLLVLGSTLLERTQEWRVPRSWVFLGDASYSLYLTHALFINVFILVGGRLGLLRLLAPGITSVAMVTVAIVSSALLYRFIERPMLNFLRQRMLGPRVGGQPISAPAGQ
jgi:exopolysaccharide production protein ExoZ